MREETNSMDVNGDSFFFLQMNGDSFLMVEFVTSYNRKIDTSVRDCIFFFFGQKNIHQLEIVYKLYKYFGIEAKRKTLAFSCKFCYRVNS